MPQSRISTVLAILLAASMLGAAPVPTNDRSAALDDVKSLFASPPRQFSCAPFWVWNDDLTTDMIVQTLRDFHGQGIRQVICHPRPGLMTPYLGERWMDLFDLAMEEARKLDMNVWIYDENSYPSGFAGGFVPEALPDAVALSIDVAETTSCPAADEWTVAVHSMKPDGSFDDVTSAARAGAKADGTRFLRFHVTRAGKSQWFAGFNYVDLLRKGVTEKFLELTMEPYRRRFGQHFGDRIPGVFTDEPHLAMAPGRTAWTEGYPELFRKRWGYDITAQLPSLVEQVGQWQRVRHNHFQLLLELFVDRWCKPYYEYCQKHRLELTGHYWEHGWPNCSYCPDNVAFSAWQQRPGIDQLFQNYDEGPNAQFGNTRMVREIGSVVNQLGQPRTLCETYGGYGWELEFDGMKRISDWLYALGINTINQHLSYVSTRGSRKRDYPPSFSYHEPWWSSYSFFAARLARLAVAVSHGEQVNSILVIEPTTTAWLHHADPANRDALTRLGVEFQKMVVELEKAQVESDIGCEDVIARHGAVEGKALKVGRRLYDVVVIAPETLNLNGPTVRLLEQMLKAGGRVICCAKDLSLVEGQASGKYEAMARSDGWTTCSGGELVAKLQREEPAGVAIRRNTDDKANLLHNRRTMRDGELLFLVNTSDDRGSSGTIRCAGAGVEEWDPDTGKCVARAFRMVDGAVETDYELPPCGSVLLAFTKKRMEPAAARAPAFEPVKAAGGVEVRAESLNVLRLDYLDLEAKDKKTTGTHFGMAQVQAFKQHGMRTNPWIHAIQFRDEWLSRTFPPDSGFTATYRFVVAERVPEQLYAAVERPDLYTIACNGTTVTAEKGKWWLDRCMDRIDIRQAARVGENTLTLTARPFTVFHEIEAAFVLGTFALKASDTGFTIMPGGGLAPGKWNEQGWPFYGETVTYAQRFDAGKPGGEYWVELPEWKGALATVKVNGKPAGQIYCRPWRCDVTGCMSDGENRIEVSVTGTLKSTLGPHFGKQPAEGPPPGTEYQVPGYGLFKPFALLRAGK